MKIIALLITIIIVILASLILTLASYYRLKKSKEKLFKATIIVVKKYITRKIDFTLYFSAMTGLVGPFFFSKIELSLAHLTKDEQTIMTLSASDVTPTSLVIVIASLITVAYLFFCYKRIGSIIPKDVTKATELINNTFSFILTQEWFEDISKATIKDLGDKYDEKINYPYANMDILLASLRRDSSIKQVVDDKLRDIKSKINDFYKRDNNQTNDGFN